MAKVTLQSYFGTSPTLSPEVLAVAAVIGSFGDDTAIDINLGVEILGTPKRPRIRLIVLEDDRDALTGREIHMIDNLVSTIHRYVYKDVVNVRPHPEVMH